MARLLIDPEVRKAMNKLLARSENRFGEETKKRLTYELQAASYLIGQDPQIGRAVDDCPNNYRRIKLKNPYNTFGLYFRYDAADDTVVIYMLRSDAQKLLRAATHKRMASASRKRAEN